MLFNVHYRLERRMTTLLIGIVVAASIGGLVEIAPLFTIEGTVEAAPNMRLLTPLEVAGRDIYVREGCYLCHSQMIRTLQDEVDRYGHYSLAVESKYDHPMLWGSKRIGPDLARVGGKYSDEWHVRHLIDPRAVVPQSIMPRYAFLAQRDLKTVELGENLAALRAVGVPYTPDMIDNASADATAQVAADSSGAAALLKRYGDATNVREFAGSASKVTEMDALVAYLQMLGKLTNPEDAGANKKSPDND